MEKGYYTIKEAAKLFEIPILRVWQMIRQGYIVAKWKGTTVVSFEEMNKWFRERPELFKEWQDRKKLLDAVN